MLAADQRAWLLARAREALERAVRREPEPVDEAPPPADWTPLYAEGGVFVTLKTNNALRGCLGCFQHPPPLYRTVAEYARNSALEDPRFTTRRLRPEELPRVQLDISVLSPLSPCKDPMAITTGRHGIYLSGHGRSGCFLPQVATETGWDAYAFWERCCVDKAGLPSLAWRDDPDVSRYTFTAEVFGD